MIMTGRRSASDLPRNLIIVDNQRIRLHRAPAQA
jgi:hypothetical protein